MNASGRPRGAATPASGRRLGQAGVGDAPPEAAARATQHGWVFGLLAFALALRILLAIQMPAVARDGVTFCWYAQQLGERGVEYLRDPQTRQHPLYPALILAAQRAGLWFGAGETPVDWQRAGQLVSIVSSVLAVWFTGRIARGLVERLALPLRADSVERVALFLAAITPLSAELGAQVMSDPTHLAAYLGAAWAAMGLLPGDAASAAGRVAAPSTGRALACGIVSGIAFLTRPEGVAPALAAVAAALFVRGAGATSLRARQAALVVAGLSAVAAPYWAVTGKFSAKKDPLGGWEAPAPVAAPAGALLSLPADGTCGLANGSSSLAGNPGAAPRFAKLERIDYSTIATPFVVLYTLFRAGRVVLVLFGLPPLWNLAPRWRAFPVLPLLLTMLITLLAGTWLLHRHHYLDQRHLLPAAAILTPFAALLIARLHAIARDRRQPWVHGVVAGVAYLPLLYAAARVPNFGQGYWREAAASLAAADARLHEKTIFSGTSGQRLAFYAGAAWLYWPEHPEDYSTTVWQMESGRPDYFAIELGDGFETRGNAEMLARMRGDPRLGPYMREILRRSVIDRRELYIFALDWPPTAPAETAPASAGE
jgi:hypothetical protein